EAAERAQRAVIAQLEAVADTAERVLQQMNDALSAATRNTEDARSALRDAYDREREALEAVTEQVETARGALTEAYQREASALVEVGRRMEGFVHDLQEFGRSLLVNPLAMNAPGREYAATGGEFQRVMGLI